MPIIPEDSVMEEFVNWDNAEPRGSSANEAKPPGTNLDLQPVQDNLDFDLALANIDGDDFSFWALEHFETSNFNPGHARVQSTSEHVPGVTALELRDFQHAPCDACDASGFTCKRIEEGQYKGYCTSCVALRHNCSFGLASPSDNTAPGPFPSNTWPLTGDSSPTVLPEDPHQDTARSLSSPEMANLAAGAEFGKDNSPNPPAVPKIGARFSRESVRILKAWLSTHANRPYPSEEERESLQRQTGLNKTQITNWLANARRRSKGKYLPTRSASPSLRGLSGAIEIPPRRGTPAMEHMNPLQRWENSPPENEPASVTAIASAILNNSDSSNGSGHNSPYSLNFTDDDADLSCRASSASSFGTSPSSGSFASRVSYHSRGSLGSFGSLQQRGRRRRRRRVVPKQGDEKTALNTPLKTFQCTFCTETFRTKHDWQRHEKSLHLSLERWICCPRGPRALNPDTNQTCCAFCSVSDPDNAHIESHNYSSCQERQLDERTFYRKDHLRQHLKLVHNSKYLNWSMDSWRVATPNIKWRCGFCGVTTESWAVRVDHLAEHFKTGFDMKDWKGDWGFEPMILSIVENALPPWLISDERNTPLPYQASQQSPESPRSAYELIKLELAYYLQKARDAARSVPSDDEMQHEACCIIYSSEALSKGVLGSRASWLRDLFMSSDQINRRAQLNPLRGVAENRLGHLTIKGKDNIFEDCLMEKQLVEFVKARMLLDLTVQDHELQAEAGNILSRMEESSMRPSDEIANFMRRLIYKDQTWLSSFRRRAGLPVSTDSMESKGQHMVSSTTYKYPQLEHELAEFMRAQRSIGVEPSDDELRRYAQSVVHKGQDNWEPTAADDLTWLNAFKQRYSQQIVQQTSPPNSNSSPDTFESLTAEGNAANMTLSPLNPALANSSDLTASPFSGSGTNSPVHSSDMAAFKRGHLFLNSPGNYRQLVRELTRYVASCMSPNNPAQHTPTDEEIRHQARWIMYDDGDPFNITAADNAEWLTRFKRSTGILPATDGPGLPETMGVNATGTALRKPWQVSGSSSGFTSTNQALPQASLTHPAALRSGDLNADFMDVPGVHSTGPISKPVSVDSGVVFSSQDFETKLMQFAVAEVASSGRMPADDALKARAKELSGMEVWQAETTAADDPVLLDKFKTLVVDKVRAVLGGQDDGSPRQRMNAVTTPPPAARTSERGMDAIDPGLLPDLPPPSVESAKKSCLSPLPANLQVAITEQRLDEILRDI